jgi:hypothetical protein
MNISYLSQNINTVETNYRNIILYKYNNINFTGYSLYYPNVLLQSSNNELILPYNEKFMSFNRKTIYEENNMIYNNELISQNYLTKIYSNPVYFFIYNTENYYHFIYDSLPYLWYYLKLKKEIPNLQLLVQYPSDKKEFIYSFVKETFELLNINEYCLLDSNVIYSEVYISSSLTHEDKSNDPPNKEIFEIYNLLINNALQKNILNSTFNNKLYISRRTHVHNNLSNIGTNYTQRRICKNEDEIVKLCQSNGYEEVFPENWSMTEKIIRFYNATHVIGLIGGGICNLVFSKKSTYSYIIISPYFFDINYRFRYTIEHTKFTYFNDTYLLKFENSNLSPYIRIIIISGEHKDKYGEIINKEDEYYNILLGSYTSVNIPEKSNTIKLKIEEFKKIDNGLNSPFYININTFKDYLLNE